MKKTTLLIAFFFFLLTLSTSHVFASSDYRVEFISHATPSVMDSNREYQIKVTVKNVGNLEWKRSEEILLSYHWVNDKGEVAVFDGRRSVLPYDVQPNETVEINATVLSPKGVGDYELVWDMVQERVHWFSDYDKNNVTKQKVTIQQAYGSVFLKSNVSSIYAGDEKEVEVTVKNNGTTVWKKSGGFNLSYHWVNDKNEMVVFDGVRTSLPKDVHPGESVVIKAKIQAPSTPGDYQLQWDMVHELVTWFSQTNPDNLGIESVTVKSRFEILIYIVVIALGSVLAIKKGLIKVPEKVLKLVSTCMRSLREIILRNISIIWFFFAVYIKIVFFSSITNVTLTGEAKVLTLSVLCLLSLALSLIKNGRVKNWIALFCNFAIGFLLIADIVYWRYFNDFLSVSVLSYATQVSSLGGSIGELMNSTDLLFLADVIILSAVHVFGRSRENATKQIPSRSTVYSKIVFAVLSLSLVYIIASEVKEVSRKNVAIFTHVFYNKLLVENLGAFNYHIFDIMKYTYDTYIDKPEVSSEMLAEIREWNSEHQEENTQTNELFGIAKNHNLLLIQEESLQEFVINLKIDGQEITPNFNKLIKESMYFENFYDQTNLGRTSDGEFTALASLYPLASGSVYIRYPANEYDSLPRLLKDQGYTTFSAHPNSGDFWNREIAHLNLGFEQTVFKDDLQNDEMIGWGLSDASFFKQAVNKLDQIQGPFFSFLISLTNHHPYGYIPAEQRELKLGDLENTILGDYLHSVHYVDQSLGELIDELKAKGLYDKTVIAIYGDHDAGLSKEDLAKIGGVSETEFNLKNMDKVPFLIHIPGQKTGRKITDVSGHLDVTPTLLHLLGIRPEGQYFMGYNQLNDTENRVIVFRNGSFVSNTSLFITENGTFESGTCYKFPEGEKQDKNMCKTGYQEGQKRILFSDSIVKGDLIPKLKKEK